MPKPITPRATAGAVFFTSPGGHRALFGESFDIPPRFIGIESVGGCSSERRPFLSTHRCRNQPHRKSLPNHPECASEPIGSFSGEVFLLTPRPRCQVVCHAIRSAACQWTVRTTCTAIMRSDSSPCRTSFPVRRMHRRSENINTGLHSDGNRFRQGSFREATYRSRGQGPDELNRRGLLIHLLHSGWFPGSVKNCRRGFVRPIQPKQQNEFAVRRGEPVGFLLWPWIRRLHIQV